MILYFEQTSVIKKRTQADPVFNLWGGLTRKQTGHKKNSILKIKFKKLEVPRLSIGFLTKKILLLIGQLRYFTIQL